MSICSRCNGPNADLFTTTGDLVCRACFSADQNQQADARARESLQRDAPLGHTIADPSAPPPSPGKMIATGLALMGGSLGFAVLTMALVDRVYPIAVGLVFIAGFANLARGLALRRR